MESLWHLLIGAVAGFLAGLVMKGRGFGLFGNAIVGVIGGFIGGKIAGFLGMDLGEGSKGHLITAFAGAVIFLFALGLIRPGKK